MTRTAALAQGWGISLLFRGRNVGERSVGDGVPVCLGEDPSCTLVVPGLGDSVPLALGDRLLHVPGLTGTVHRPGSDRGEAFVASTTLVPGEHAELRFTDHPEITLELRRQTFERLPLATLINVRELGRQLALGAGLVAGLILLVRSEKPVNTLEIKGEPDAPEDSLLVRAMFAATVAPPLPTVDLRWLPPPAPLAPAPELPLAVVEPGTELVEAAPPPIAEPVPEAPLRARKRRGSAETDLVATLTHSNYAILGTLDSDPDSEIGGVLGGVVGGTVRGTALSDVLAEQDDDAAGLAIGGGGFGLSGVGEPVKTVDIADGPELVEAEEVVELKEVEREQVVERPSEVLSGPVAILETFPVPPGSEHPGVPGGVLHAPSPPGPISAAPHGGAGVRGSVDGLAAVAPDGSCEDPTITRKPQLDVVFVVDVSTTMGFLLDRIEKQLGQVDSEARAQGLDTRYGLVVFVDDVLLANNGQPYADLAAVQKDLAHWQAFTSGNRQIHSAASNLDWPENSLDALHRAATGFAWRPADTTLRMIVHATDDDFGEAPAVQSGQTIQHNYLEVVTALRAAEVRMFSFAAKIGGQCECLDVRPGLFTRHHGRASLPDATGGSVFDIDEVARGTLGFAAAVGGAIKSGVCTRYPLSPFGARPPAAASQ